MEQHKAVLDRLTGLARINNDKGWEEIDNVLLQHTDNQVFFDWAKKNIKNPNGGLRDLAATILEKTTLEVGDVVIADLFVLMNEVREENPYPSFRAACALARRREDSRVTEKIGQVRSKLESYIDDQGLKSIAEGYLKNLV